MAAIKTYSQFFHAKNTVAILFFREWARVFKEPSRMVGVLMQPLLFLFVFGAGFSKTFFWQQAREIDYATFFFPGILGLVLLFSSIYATLTLIEDKKCGLFKTALLAPGGAMAAVFGKVVATASLGFVQSLLFLPLGTLFVDNHGAAPLFATLVLLAAGSVCFSLIGVLFAWASPSSAAFHALMSVILIPMWLLSGAMFPLDHKLFVILSKINPMTFLVDGLRAVMVGVGPNPWWSLVNILGFALAIFMLLVFTVKRKPVE